MQRPSLGQYSHIFVPQTDALRIEPDIPVILIFDGHGSHETLEVKTIAYEQGNILVAFPSKTTHKLQPLDVGIFGPLQRRWYVHANKCTGAGKKINRYTVIQEYCEIRDVMTPSLVQKAFKHTGIYPLNPNLFTEEDFAPSRASSILPRAHLPLSYPSPTEVASPETNDSTVSSSQGSSSRRFDPFNPTMPPSMPSKSTIMNSTYDELWQRIQLSHAHHRALFELYEVQKRQLDTANVHCIVAERKIARFAEQLANKKNKPTSQKKINARFVTLPELRETFEQQKAEQAEKEQAEAAKIAQKKADDAARMAQIAQDINTKLFGPLSTCKVRDDYLTLAGALGLDRDGTVRDLRERIKAHLDLPETRQNLAHQPRFSALFSNGRRGRQDRDSLPSGPTPSDPQNGFTQLHEFLQSGSVQSPHFTNSYFFNQSYLYPTDPQPTTNANFFNQTVFSSQFNPPSYQFP